MSGAIMNKIWGAFGMEPEENDEDIDVAEDYEEEDGEKENKLWGRKKVVSMPQS